MVVNGIDKLSGLHDGYAKQIKSPFKIKATENHAVFLNMLLRHPYIIGMWASRSASMDLFGID